MLPESQARKRPNVVAGNWLFVILLSPLPCPLGYLESYSQGYPEDNSGDYPEGYSGSNSESYPVSYSEDYPEGYPPRYSESYPGSYRESYPEDCSRNCPESCSGDNSEGNRGDYPEDYPESSWEGSSLNSPARNSAGSKLPQLDDLGAEAGTGFDDVDAGREHPHIIRARFKSHDLPP